MNNLRDRLVAELNAIYFNPPKGVRIAEAMADAALALMKDKGK